MDRLISHTGRVHAIEGNTAQIAVMTAACSSCGHAGGCSIGKLAGKQRQSLIAVPADGLRLGQSVTLTLDESRLTQAALLGYLRPAVMFLAGAVLGESVGEKVDAGDTLAVIGAGIGLLVGLLVTRLRTPLTPRLTQELHHV